MSRDDLVYSTDHGRMCPDCGRPKSECTCHGGRGGDGGAGGAGRSGPVRVQRTSKGRKGKTVSLITGLGLNPFELADLARALKQKCGTGGTAKDDIIEIQGDHVDTLVEELRRRGFDAKRSGG